MSSVCGSEGQLFPVGTDVTLSEQLERGACFLPDEPGRLSWIHRVSLSRRQAELVGLGLWVTARRELQSADVVELVDFAQRPPHERIAILTCPLVGIWLDQILRHVADTSDPAQTTTQLLADLSQFSGLVEVALSDPRLPRRIIAETVEVRRYDVHPLLAAAASPIYTFTNDRPPTDYGLESFIEDASLALDRIATSWFPIRKFFPTFVQTIVHLPDGSYSSASGKSHRGVIFLFEEDNTCLSLEQSLIHEFGHQILYAVTDIDPLFVEGENGQITSPWSGNELNWRRYFHAFFIYVLLAEYLLYRDLSVQTDREQVRIHIGQIIGGLKASVGKIESSGPLTEAGQLLVRNLCSRVAAITSRAPRGQ